MQEENQRLEPDSSDAPCSTHDFDQPLTEGHWRQAERTPTDHPPIHLDAANRLPLTPAAVALGSLERLPGDFESPAISLLLRQRDGVASLPESVHPLGWTS